MQASNNGGPVIGGASLWIDGPGHSAAEQRGAWEFAKFLIQPENSAYWHTQTGYFPVSKAALDEDVDKKWVAEKPQFQTAIDQLAATPSGVATQGCLPQVRALVETAIESVLTSGKDPQGRPGRSRQPGQGLDRQVQRRGQVAAVGPAAYGGGAAQFGMEHN